MNRQQAVVPAPTLHRWSAFIRGFGAYMGDELYPTVEEARDAASPGERIYQVTHVETVISAPEVTS